MSLVRKGHGPTHCMISDDHHSPDLIEIWHGWEEPALACGFHAFLDPAAVFAAHRALMLGVVS